MKKQTNATDTARGERRESGKSRQRREHVQHDAEGAAGGAVAGAALGAIGGPPGVVAGAVIGGLAGAVAAATADVEEARRSQDKLRLDAELGVEGGELGATNLEHPPARIGAYSAGSMGSSAAKESSTAPAEGPIQPLDD